MVAAAAERLPKELRDLQTHDNPAERDKESVRALSCVIATAAAALRSAAGDGHVDTEHAEECAERHEQVDERLRRRDLAIGILVEM